MAAIGMDPCEKCDEITDHGRKKTQDCEHCETVKLMPGNNLYWTLCCAVTPGVLRGDGSIDMAAIGLVFNVYDIDDRETAFNVVLSYALAIQKDRIDDMKGRP